MINSVAVDPYELHPKEGVVPSHFALYISPQGYQGTLLSVQLSPEFKIIFKDKEITQDQLMTLLLRADSPKEGDKPWWMYLRYTQEELDASDNAFSRLPEEIKAFMAGYVETQFEEVELKYKEWVSSGSCLSFYDYCLTNLNKQKE